MADISIISRLLNGVQRNVDISANTLVTTSIKVGGSVSNTELTKTILDRLVSLQNGTDVGAGYHTHDGRYFTETELGSATSSSGSDLIGDDNTYTNFTPSAATVKGALEGIDSALAGVSAGTEFADNTFRLYDEGDATKKIAFQASGISTATVRTITMPDANVNLADVNNAVLVNGTRAFTADQSMGGNKLTSLAAGTASGDAVNYAQLQAVQSIIQNFEWQPSVKTLALDSTVLTPATGDRYLISAGDGGGLVVASGDFSGHEEQIAQWNGSAYVFTTPTLGTFVSADDVPNSLYYFGGTQWTAKYFESTTASTGLTKVGFDIRLASSAAGSGLGFSSGVLSVNVDGSTLEINADTLRVKASGITENELSTSVAGNGLAGGGGTALSVNVDGSTIEIASDTVRVKDAGISAAKLANASVTAAKLNTDVADQFTITGGAGFPLVATGAYALKQNVAVGENLAANTTFAMRFAVTGESAGNLYKADVNAFGQDLYWVAGLITTTTAVTAPAQKAMTFKGYHTVDASEAFNAADVGKPVWLSSVGGFSVTAPSAADTAAFKIGIVADTLTIYVDGQLMGIN